MARAVASRVHRLSSRFVRVGGLVVASAVLLAAASRQDGVFIRFKMLEPVDTSYHVNIGAYVHVEPWTVPSTPWPAGADKDPTKRTASGAATDWFDVAKYV